MILTRLKIFNQHVLFYSYFMLAVAILIFFVFFLAKDKWMHACDYKL